LDGFGVELAAVSSFYAAKIAAARRGPARDIAAAVRAIRNEDIILLLNYSSASAI